MSVGVNDNVIKHNGDGTTDTFGYDFKIFADTDLEVTVDGSTWTITSDYTVTGAGTDAGGNCVFVSGKEPPSGTNNVILVGDIPETQQVTFAEGDKFPAITVNDSLDKLTRLIQQHSEIIARCLKVPKDFTSTTFNAELGDPGASASLGNPFRISTDGLSIESFTLDSADTLNVVTTEGDLIVGGTGGVAQRLAEGSADGVLLVRDSSVAGNHAWTAAPTVNAVPMWDSADHVWTYPPDIPNNHTPAIPMNFALSVTQASSALTIAVKGQDGSDPSATNPVWMPFRNSTITNGSYVWEKITSALSLTVPDGASLGGGTGDSLRCYVYGLWNSNDDVEISVARRAKFDSSQLQSTTAIDTTSDNVDVLYSETARTSKPVILAGVVEATLASGSWDTVDSVTVWKPGMFKTGDVIDRARATIGYTAFGSHTQTPADNTTPQVTEGEEIFSVAYQATSLLNDIRIKADFSASHSTGQTSLTAHLHLDGAANANNTWTDQQFAGDAIAHLHLLREKVATALTSITYSIRVGGNAAGTLAIGGIDTQERGGGEQEGYMLIEEIYA